MTFKLAMIMALAGAVGLSTFIAALWGALEAHSTLVHLQEKNASEETIVLAKLMVIRSGGRAFLTLVLSTIAVLRLAAADLLVTSSTYAMFVLLLVAQMIVALFVILDVYERTSVFPDDKD